jgi:glycosyltransferase involved in cell wall biosynthesis
VTVAPDSSSPLVSLVMPTWKPQAVWFRQAVEGALAQRGCRFELVVIDDGSPEPVAELLDGIDDQRLRVERIPHGGLAKARNAGAALAAGDYVRFIDSDDVCERDSTARLLNLMNGTDDFITYGATLVCNSDLRPVWKMASRLKGKFTVECLLGRFVVRPHTLLFPRRVLEATGEFDSSLRVSDDWDFVLRASEHARTRGDRAVATFYRRHSSSVTTDISTGEQDARRIVDSYFDRHPDQRGTRLERLAEARLEVMTARMRASHGQPRGALEHLRKAVLLDPRSVAYEVAQIVPALWGHLRYGRFSRLASQLAPTKDS